MLKFLAHLLYGRQDETEIKPRTHTRKDSNPRSRPVVPVYGDPVDIAEALGLNPCNLTPTQDLAVSMLYAFDLKGSVSVGLPRNEKIFIRAFDDLLDTNVQEMDEIFKYFLTLHDAHDLRLWWKEFESDALLELEWDLNGAVPRLQNIYHWLRDGWSDIQNHRELQEFLGNHIKQPYLSLSEIHLGTYDDQIRSFLESERIVYESYVLYMWDRLHNFHTDIKTLWLHVENTYLCTESPTPIYRDLAVELLQRRIPNFYTEALHLAQLYGRDLDIPFSTANVYTRDQPTFSFYVNDERVLPAEDFARIVRILFPELELSHAADSGSD